MCSRPSLTLTVPARGRAGITKPLPRQGAWSRGSDRRQEEPGWPDLTTLALVPCPDQEPWPGG